MHFKLRNTVSCADDGQLLPIEDCIEEINPVLRWADAKGRVQA
jgi:hypothetical protein